MTSLDVDERSVRALFVRHIPHDADPLYQPPEPPDGRWQRGDITPAWYLADEPATVWAEWYRALAGTGLPPSKALPRDLWQFRVDLDRVAFVDSDERLQRVGLPPPLPTTGQWPACQRIGEKLFRDGYQGLLFASAARPNSHNLVVFRTGRDVPGCTPEPPPEAIREIPPVPRGMRT